MATPRSRLVDDQLALHYHIVSRCVRRSWLCDSDRYSGKNYNHRKAWIISRLFHLARYFAVEVEAFAIMSNHFHLVLYYDPLASDTWTDEEVAYRWSEVFPPRTAKNNHDELAFLKELQIANLLESPGSLQSARRCLGSLSAFMKHLKQPIAWRANQEDNCRGHFFEGRFYSGALLTESAVLAAMAYVDLNPVRAKIVKTIEQSHDSSIGARLKAFENTPERLKDALAPLVSGLDATDTRITMTLAMYIEHLRWTTVAAEPSQFSDEQSRWFARVAAIKKRQRAFGLIDDLKDWILRHGHKRLGDPLPG
ncbi:MAG: transposase [Gammaproteobacteria bacterium]|jgi:hypothetical protein|nr:transposase [Gammaproteobacteria bacterium]|tara:strand:- start:108 stop:1034 length:927 start_codon:yes stop_codon:yes gene_type:complete